MFYWLGSRTQRNYLKTFSQWSPTPWEEAAAHHRTNHKNRADKPFSKTTNRIKETRGKTKDQSAIRDQQSSLKWFMKHEALFHQQTVWWRHCDQGLREGRPGRSLVLPQQGAESARGGQFALKPLWNRYITETPIHRWNLTRGINYSIRCNTQIQCCPKS